MQILAAMTLFGDPVPKARPRSGRGGHFYTPTKTVKAEKVIAEAIATIVRTPYDGPVGLSLGFWTQTRRRTDGDNLQKLVMDALNRVAITDDYLVEQTEWFLRRREPGEQPRTEVVLYALEAPVQDRHRGLMASAPPDLCVMIGEAA